MGASSNYVVAAASSSSTLHSVGWVGSLPPLPPVGVLHHYPVHVAALGTGWEFATTAVPARCSTGVGLGLRDHYRLQCLGSQPDNGLARMDGASWLQLFLSIVLTLFLSIFPTLYLLLNCFLNFFFSTFSTQSSVFAPQWAGRDGWSKLAATFPLDFFNTAVFAS